jgi:hypothetical protein
MRLLMVAVSLFLLLMACGPTPPATTAGANSTNALLPDTNQQVETMSAVMPPKINPSCPGGRVFVVYGRQYGATRMASSDVNCYLNGGAGCFSNQSMSELSTETFVMTNNQQSTGGATPQNFNCNTQAAPTQTISRDRVWYTDSLITRVGGHDMLHAFLTMAGHPPLHPVPNRTNNAVPVGCNNPFTTCSLAILKSSDCGNNWTKTTVFDLNDPTFMNGAWAVPEYDNQGNVNQKGFAIDRPEIFVDPFFPFPLKTAVFLTAAIRMGPQAGKTMVVKSFDGGDSWLKPVLLPNANANNGGNPTVIQTTYNHRVYAFRCEGTEPTLYWSDDYGASFSDKDKLVFKYADKNVATPLDCGLVSSKNLGANVGPGSPSIGMARWGDKGVDDIIVTYSAVLNSKQVQPVMLLTTKVPGDKNPSVTSNLLLQGQDGHSIVQATMISTDRFEFAPDESNDPVYDAVMMYWLDIASPGNGGQATANYVTVRRGLLWGNNQPLALNNGAAYNWSWNVNPANPFIGDYNRGSFLFANLTNNANAKPALNFVATWPESTAGNSPNLLIHSNMVTWKEP